LQNSGQLSGLVFRKEELWLNAKERISWHDKLDSEEAIQKRIHEFVVQTFSVPFTAPIILFINKGQFFYNNKFNAGWYQWGTWKVQFRCYYQHHQKALTFTPMPYELLFFLLQYLDHCMNLLLR
jgi:hypothetical protein